MRTQRYYIGLMSGTSADGIDLALVDFSVNKPKLLASYYQAYQSSVHNKITALYKPASNEIDRAFSLDIELAHLFANAINTFLQQQKLTSKNIIAIGNHGQTIRHRPALVNPFTLQIGCCQTLATLTNITVIGEFRRKDMALGGQGAPLVPAFHQHIFSDPHQDVFVINIGGIANISYLPREKHNAIIGFDTGPGNALMDDWFVLNKAKHHSSQNYDNNGDWGKSGRMSKALLTLLLDDNYFKKLPPKSTGREHFNLTWLKQYLSLPDILSLELSAQDIQATLSALTATTIANEVKTISKNGQIYFCGGGIQNKTLKNQLFQQLTKYEIIHTNQKGIDSDSLEAMAFAWLAFAYNKKIFSNIPAVTGACKQTTLGTAFYP